VGALRADGFVAPLTIDGPINRAVFLAWFERHLLPTLTAGDIVVMDNLSSHNVAGARGHRIRRCRTALPAAVLTGSESDRTGLLEAEETARRRRGTDRRQPVAPVR
jgi:transposase